MVKPYPYNEYQESWLRDLETTDEPQTRGYLHRLVEGEDDRGNIIKPGWCCLGRACVAVGFNLLEDVYEYAVFPLQIDYEGEIAPKEVCQKLRLRDSTGALYFSWSGYDCLAAANDDGVTFKEIAAYIRANPWKVFLPPLESQDEVASEAGV